ncbi:MAG: outer membrane protein assembly factor BamA [Pseudomonadota bacterium]
MSGMRRALSVLKTTTVLSLSAVSIGGMLSLLPLPAMSQATFTAVEVEGNQRIAAATVRTIAGIPTGSTVTPGQINRALQNLYDSGFFERVEIMPAGNTLKIVVIENPTINRISIEGNRRLDDEQLLPILGSQPRRTFSVSQTEADVRAIVEAYASSGRIAAEVQPLIIRRADNRIDLVFEVLEGRVTEVDNVSFIGNSEFSDSRLRRIVETRQARGAFSGLFANDTFIEDRLAFDAQQLREFYINRGYLDFQVVSSSAELSRERNTFLVTYRVIEGQRFRFGGVTVTSELEDVDVDTFISKVTLKEGQFYDPRQIDNDLARLDDEADLQGLAFVRAEPRFTRDDDNLTLSVEYELIRGPRAFVERIDIEGNSTTLDRVIRRQFDTVEGDVLNQRQIREASDRIRALGYFSSVDVQSREGTSPEQQVIDVDVEEQATGSLTFGASFNSSNGAAFNLSIVERNFLGRGQTLGASFSTATNNRNLSINFVEPSLFDRDLGFSFNLGYFEATPGFLPLDQNTLTFNPSVVFPVSENGSIRIGYKFEDMEVLAEDEDDDDAEEISDFLTADIGSYSTSSIILTYTVDLRNSRVEPTAGSILQVTQEFAGLGGSQQFSKTTASFRTFRSFFNDQLVFSAEIEGGFLEPFGDTNVPVFDRFNLGGDSFRGFQDFGIGPRDMNEDPLGGLKYAVARFEASFPLGLPEELGIFGGVFLDVGTVWDLDPSTVSEDLNGDMMTEAPIDDGSDLRAAAGVSIFWETAIGPLRFNFSRALESQPEDETEDFRFTVDARF